MIVISGKLAAIGNIKTDSASIIGDGILNPLAVNSAYLTESATQEEVNIGTISSKYVSPATIHDLSNNSLTSNYLNGSAIDSIFNTIELVNNSSTIWNSVTSKVDTSIFDQFSGNIIDSANYLSAYINEHESAWNKDTTYTNGKYIDIIDNVISVTGIDDEISGLSSIYATKIELSSVSGILQNEIDSLSSNISIVSGDVFKNTNNLITISSDLINVIGDVETNSANINDLSSSVTKNRIDIDTNSANISELSGLVITNRDDISENSANIYANLQAINSLSSSLSSYETIIEADRISAYLSGEINKKMDEFSAGNLLKFEDGYLNFTGELLSSGVDTKYNVYIKNSANIGYLIPEWTNSSDMYLKSSGDKLYWTSGSEGIADIKIYGHNGIDVLSSTEGNTLIFDLSGSESGGLIGYINVADTKTNLQNDDQLLNTPSVISNYLYTTGTNSITIPSGVGKICVNVNANFSNTGNVDQISNFGINMLIDNDIVIDNMHANSVGALSSEILTYSKFVNLDTTKSHSLYLKYSGDNSIFDLNSLYLDVYENTTGSMSGTGENDKVAVTNSSTPGYLNDVVSCKAPIQKLVSGNNLVIYQDPVEASPLSLLCSPAMDVSTTGYSVIYGASVQQADKPGMALHAFEITNYFVPELTDKYGLLNINTQSSTSLTMLYELIFKWDKDLNRLNLICTTDNISACISAIGYHENLVSYINPDHNMMSPYGIYYGGYICDQTALQLAAGPLAINFNINNPYMGIVFHNLPNCKTLSDITANYSYIDISNAKNAAGTSISFQEGNGRSTIMLRHNED